MSDKSEFTESYSSQSNSSSETDEPVKRKNKSNINLNNKNKQSNKNNSKQPEKHIIPFESLPENLKSYITKDIWITWSFHRQQSYQQMLNNPNTFFYRNRPPWESQKCGPFTNQEEILFLERLNYFRDSLGINDGMWGYFSVPIIGRVGYQCSNFYRLLVLEKKIIDNNYILGENGRLKCVNRSRSKLNKKSLNILEQEAIKYISEYIQNNNLKNFEPKKTIITKKEKKIIYESTSSSTEIYNEEEDLEEEEEEEELQEEEEEEEEIIIKYNLCPFIGAKDQITNKPMKRPTINPNGFMLDYNTWINIINKKINYNIKIDLCNINELIEITSKNYEKYKLEIINVFI